MLGHISLYLVLLGTASQWLALLGYLALLGSAAMVAPAAV